MKIESLVFKTKTYSLKNGKTITIRQASIQDAKALLNLKREYIADTSTIPLTLEEYPNDVSNEEKIITKYIDHPNSLLLVATHHNDLIGNIDLTGNKLEKMAHTGMIGMGIKREWRNQGLGKCLLTSVIDWAKKNATIEMIWLDVYASNEYGYNLYKNTGFKVSGIIPDFFKDENGYQDKIQMYQHIK